MIICLLQAKLLSVKKTLFYIQLLISTQIKIFKPGRSAWFEKVPLLFVQAMYSKHTL